MSSTNMCSETTSNARKLNNSAITVNKHLGNHVLAAGTLQVLSIITNELLSNIMKCAFIGRVVARLFSFLGNRGQVNLLYGRIEELIKFLPALINAQALGQGPGETGDNVMVSGQFFVCFLP